MKPKRSSKGLQPGKIYQLDPNTGLILSGPYSEIPEYTGDQPSGLEYVLVGEDDDGDGQSVSKLVDKDGNEIGSATVPVAGNEYGINNVIDSMGFTTLITKPISPDTVTMGHIKIEPLTFDKYTGTFNSFYYKDVISVGSYSNINAKFDVTYNNIGWKEWRDAKIASGALAKESFETRTWLKSHDDYDPHSVKIPYGAQAWIREYESQSNAKSTYNAELTALHGISASYDKVFAKVQHDTAVSWNDTIDDINASVAASAQASYNYQVDKWNSTNEINDWKYNLNSQINAATGNYYGQLANNITKWQNDFISSITKPVTPIVTYYTGYVPVPSYTWY